MLLHEDDPRLHPARMAFHAARRAHHTANHAQLLLRSLHPNDLSAIAHLRTSAYRARTACAQAKAAHLSARRTVEERLNLRVPLAWEDIMRAWTHKLIITQPGEEPMTVTSPLTPTEFRDNSRLRFPLEELRTLTPLHPAPIDREYLLWEEYLDRNTAVRLWANLDGADIGRPYQYTGMIERREVSPLTGKPEWRVVEFYDPTRPGVYCPASPNPGYPWT